MLGCLLIPRPAAQTRDVGLNVAVAGSELSECILTEVSRLYSGDEGAWDS